MAELVWIHRTNANELGISQTPDGTGRGSFILVPVEARAIFFPNRNFNSNPEISEQIELHFIDYDESVVVNYSKPPSKSEHRLSLSGLSKFIGNDKELAPNQVLCFYRKNGVIHFSTVEEDSIYGNLLNEFPTRGKNNNLVTQTIFDKSSKEQISLTLNELITLPKPFLLLAGVSGTGKSRFVQEQAKQTGEYQLVAVRPDWHEPSDLLGYVSRLSGTPQYVMTDVLKFIITAWQAVEKECDFTNVGNKKSHWVVSGVQNHLSQIKPYWLCLDEMNLAPVEQYFADYLSVIETRKWTWTDDAFEYFTEPLLSPTAWKDIPDFQTQLGVSEKLWAFFQAHGIGIPFNLIVAGTVNMDESTHAFSRKVLDRALSFDFSQFYPNKFDEFFEPKTEPKLLGYPKLSQATNNNENAQKSIAFLTALNEKLKDTPFELAYRALNELLLSVESFSPSDDKTLQAVWDDFVMTKVLPRIEGDETKVGSLLAEIESVLKENLNVIWIEKRPDLWRKSLDNSLLEIDCRSKPKIERMKKLLDDRSMVSFW